MGSTSPLLHLAYRQRQAGEFQKDENFAVNLHVIKWIQLNCVSLADSPAAITAMEIPMENKSVFVSLQLRIQKPRSRTF